MTTKLVDSAGLSEFSSKIKEKTVFIGNSQSGNLGLLDLIYPVGSIYMSVNNVSPQTFIGGTWERIQDTFLLSAGTTYSAGSTGGSATHSHTDGSLVAEIETFTVSDLGRWYMDYSVKSSGTEWTQENRIFTGDSYQEPTFSEPGNGGVGVVGETGTASSMPPYLTVYMWKRTA